MPAINILRRYVQRKIQGRIASDHSGIRQHIAAVAARDGIAITEKELDELAGCFLTEEKIACAISAPEKPVKQRSRKKVQQDI